MPLDYSKWDALELSDDSDIEVHPNVDKRSFIRAKQNQIHQERHQRNHQIETLKYERIINDTLIKRISSLLAALKSRASDGDSLENPAEQAFAAVMELAMGLKNGEDEPPPRPEGVHSSSEKLPTFTKMMATLLDQVNQALKDKEVKPENRYSAMVAEIEEHLEKVNNLQVDLMEKLNELEKEQGKKITSESIHTGFDSSHINKSEEASKARGSNKADTKLELLNPNYSLTDPAKNADGDDADDEEMEASPVAKKFAEIETGYWRESASFIKSHPEMLRKREKDGLLVLAFEHALENRLKAARNAVHQALLLQYCEALGRDGVALFFKRMQTPGHQAINVFQQDVNDTFERIRKRTQEINQQRQRDAAESKTEGTEQIQLQTVEPGTALKIQIPPKNSQDPEVKAARAIFDAFNPKVRAALEAGTLEAVNKVLGEIPVDAAEDLVGKLSESGILNLESEVLDTTTEEGQRHLRELKAQAEMAAAETSESQHADAPTFDFQNVPEPE